MTDGTLFAIGCGVAFLFFAGAFTLFLANRNEEPSGTAPRR